MFGIGSTELLVILVVALIALGPKSLASVSRSLGKAMGEFRRVSTDFQRTLNAETAEEEMREARRKREEREAAKKQAAADDSVHSASRAGNSSPDCEGNKPAAGNPDFDAQMSRIGKWEKPDPDFTPPPGSPLADALEKSRADAARDYNAEAEKQEKPQPAGLEDLRHAG